MYPTLLQGASLLCLLLAATPPQLPLVLVPHQDMAVLIFDQPITRVYVGSQDYGAEVKQHYLLLKSKRPQVPPTSLFVLYDQGQRFFHGRLQASSTVPPAYDLRQEAAPAEEAPALRAGLAALQALPQAYCDCGVQQDQLIAALVGVLHDQAYTYLKVVLENHSSIDFHMEEVCFAYQHRAQLPLTPVLLAQEALVPAHEHRTLLYVLPLYGTQATSALMVEWREAQGERALRLSIPAALLLKAPRMLPNTIEEDMDAINR